MLSWKERVREPSGTLSVCSNNGLHRSIMCHFNVETLAVIRWTCLVCSCFNNGLLRSMKFNSFFVKRTCIDLLRTGRFSSILSGSRVNSNNGLPRSIGSNNGLPRSIMFNSFFVKRTRFDLLRTGRFSSILTRSLGRFKQRVASFYHDLGLELVGLIGTFWIVAHLVHLVVEHLLNPILSYIHVSKRSQEEAEVTHIISRLWLLQFPS